MQISTQWPPDTFYNASDPYLTTPTRYLLASSGFRLATVNSVSEPPRLSSAAFPPCHFRSLSKIPALSDMSVSVLSVVSRFFDEYVSSTPQRLKLLDAYLLYILLTGALQFLYCLLVGTFPFNSFLSGFISSVGSFILGVCLRIQINPQNKSDFQGISPERAFADFLFANTILHLVVINFIG
ncbi:dolichyl-diphosphooligosaccharide--protein glycosyltransferase subunit dad1-like [Xenopus laevis]|uniref:Dolichyl-diphosphooligosaccharide--protein glycosyltransferase subunit DAD1 n=2 Tax=Xenopus laevis TaxID=8355 RepID=A0A1L8HZ67_XENLA|nr:dolichyl-diphosphooligosaccharide--protein glycosyltransferase subunit dad1-like [Xenopus laevis]OCU01422.1 hypothetical protein XELAEV_18007211mg [Xenopus laevis]